MQGLCHADLAKAADVSEATVSYSLSDHISETSAKKLAAARGMAVEDAFKVEEPLCLSSSTVRMYHKIISALRGTTARRLRRAQSQMGARLLRPSQPPPPFHPHTLRHSMASLLIESGQDIVSVSKRLGHTKTSTTLNIYAHMLSQSDRSFFLSVLHCCASNVCLIK